MLKIVDLKKEFGSEGVLKGISLNLNRGQIGALLGASGSGKTTLLRIIAGFETQDAGQVFINGQEMSRSTCPSERSVSYLFQDFALFPHMTVLENVLVALQNISREEAYERAYAMLLLCGLLKEEKKYPDQISGGQQQRLSLARALAPRPNLLLMDEPFSNLDPELRSQLTLDVRDLIKDQGLTALMVTHLVEEAYDMADEIGIINKGVMEQWSSAHDIYRHPETEYVAQYMERASYLDVRIEKGHCFYNSIDLGKVERNVGSRLLVRPYDVVLDPSSPIVARVTNQFFRGSWVLYRLELEDGATLYAHMPSENLLDVGTKVNVRINAHLD